MIDIRYFEKMIEHSMRCGEPMPDEILCSINDYQNLLIEIEQQHRYLFPVKGGFTKLRIQSAYGAYTVSPSREVCDGNPVCTGRQWAELEARRILLGDTSR